jgi:predicted nuclease with TOPRIM domain
MGSRVEELRRREAAAQADAGRLRDRIEELAGELARAEEEAVNQPPNRLMCRSSSGR